MININSLRFNNRHINNPILLDYLLANELFLFLLNKSYFHNNITLSDDYFYLVDKDYPKNLVNIKLNVSKYKLNEDSIKEIVNALNINTSEIKIIIDSIFVDEYKNYHVTLSFFDNYKNSITKIRYIFFENYVASKGLRDASWITLPILKEKIYVRLEAKELVLARNITSLLYENSFYINLNDSQRINYLLTKHLYNNLMKKSFELEIRFRDYKKDIYKNDILDILKLSDIKSNLDVNKIILLLANLG